MSLTVSNNKRIAKNTLFLYLRMFVTMCVGFFTSRIVLQVLGVSDYGVFSVMGGIMGMLGYIDALLSGGTSRFLTMALGSGNVNLQRNTFSTAVILALISSAVILILGETIGLWFMNSKLNIEPDRMGAANWVYQCALFTMCFGIMQTPYTASIVSHERMKVFAYMSIYDVVMKLLVVYLLLAFDYDKLKLYAVFLLVVSLTGTLITGMYCLKQFEECRFRLVLHRDIFKEMFVFSGWNMVASFSGVLNNYGMNILLNIFFGTIVNASRAIALQVSGIVQQFCYNFQMASRPQIMKYYAQGNITDMTDMIVRNAKYSTLMLLCIGIPICFNITGLMQIWLGQVPLYAPEFVVLVVIQVIIMSLDFPLGFGIHAVGKMRLPNLTTGFLNLAIFPISYLALRLGATPVVSYVVYISISPLILGCDIWLLHRFIQFDWRRFVFQAIVPVVGIGAASCVIPFILCFVFTGTGWTWSLFSAFVSLFSTVFVCYYLGLSHEMRLQVRNIIIQRFKVLCRI